MTQKLKKFAIVIALVVSILSVGSAFVAPEPVEAADVGFCCWQHYCGTKVCAIFGTEHRCVSYCVF